MTPNDRFHIVRRLDAGAFGEVFQGVDRTTGLPVAVKFLQSQTDDALRRFIHETEILWQNINNPYIVRIIAYDIDNRPPYIVMEFCEGGSLRAWVSQRRTWIDIAAALIHAGHGLVALHSLGGFHQDIKPDNLLIKSNGSGGLIIKVADFGLARVPVSVAPMTATARGTPQYLAPELYAGSPMSPAADIYSLGITGIELLTGSRDTDTLKTAICPSRLKQLLSTMTSSMASQRPNGLDVLSTLSAILTDEQTRQQLHPISPPLLVPNTSSPLAPLLLAGLIIGGVALIAAAAAKDP